jgi:hypothetical protein
MLARSILRIGGVPIAATVPLRGLGAIRTNMEEREDSRAEKCICYLSPQHRLSPQQCAVTAITQQSQPLPECRTRQQTKRPGIQPGLIS